VTQTDFWKRVKIGKPDQCWPWRSAYDMLYGTRRRTAGTVYHEGRQQSAHRVAWAFKHGSTPEGPIYHTCGNPPCVNPGHLTQSTFWSHVEVGKPNACWPWTGPLQKNGYGHARHQGRLQLAHRLVWLFERGPIPLGRCVRHRCGNPLCCNPKHLFLATQADIARDIAARGLNVVRGSQHGRAKLSDGQVQQIRRLREAGWTLARLTERFGISSAQASGIASRKYWTHVA
jgi:HNH endonuclease